MRPVFLLPPFFLLLGACLPKPPVASFTNDSAYPDKLFEQGWALTEMLSNEDIDLSEFDVHIYEDEAAFRNACPDVDGLGCTDGHSKLAILGAVGTDFPSVGRAVAHQLGHIFLYQTTRDIDGSHNHAEWFGEAGYEAQVYLYLLNEENKNATQN